MLEGLGPTRLPAEHFNLYRRSWPGCINRDRLRNGRALVGRSSSGSLIVVPLYFWIRRQFDDRTAVVGVRAGRTASEIDRVVGQLVRDPTFCLFATCALYAGFRAATERSIGWFAAAGAGDLLGDADAHRRLVPAAADRRVDDVRIRRIVAHDRSTTCGLDRSVGGLPADAVAHQCGIRCESSTARSSAATS